jgi:hypothetical protein
MGNQGSEVQEEVVEPKKIHRDNHHDLIGKTIQEAQTLVDTYDYYYEGKLIEKIIHAGSKRACFKGNCYVTTNSDGKIISMADNY